MSITKHSVLVSIPVRAFLSFPFLEEDTLSLPLSCVRERHHLLLSLPGQGENTVTATCHGSNKMSGPYEYHTTTSLYSLFTERFSLYLVHSICAQTALDLV